MFKRTAVLLSITLFSLVSLLWFTHSVSSESPPALPLPLNVAVVESPPAANIFIHQSTSGALTVNNQAVMGPDSCSSYGDPYSPLNPTWEGGDAYQGLHTYRYRLSIPADYAEDVVRVELFDPDSINALNNNGSSYTTTVAHTQAWINSGLPPAEQLACNASNTNTCLIDTREDEVLDYPLESVNPWWFVRIDENRTGNGSGTGCGSPSSYNPSYNTQTIYELSYKTASTEVPLARYTGQVSDTVRDSGDHLTDMRWVSPGGQMGYDQPAAVPTEFGSFEVDLTQDTPDIVVDPVTGDRSLYLAVTAVTGASENGWDIWAGPPDYINTISSNVNTRNVQVINNPASHDTHGIQIYALDAAPSNSDYTSPVDRPLIYLGPEYAGQEVYITLFDSDSGATPPIIFFFDTLAESDWSLTFGNNASTHPDNAPDYDTSGRCIIGSCQDKWVSPPFKITIPTFDAAACAAEPGNQAVCTPFYGGRLMATHRGGQSDTYVWKISQPEPNYQLDQGCTAFPIAPVVSRRSISQANYNALAPQVSYPATLPSYYSFGNHVPNAVMSTAHPGYVYWLSLENLDAYFLRWNVGIDQGSHVLADSLTWPGNTQDYTDHSDSGTPFPPYPYVVRGFMEVGDETDQALHLRDRIGLNETAVLRDDALKSSLMDMIDLNRVVRLPVTDFEHPEALSGDVGYVEAANFGLFRIVGYSESNNWLLLTFTGWDTSCGQGPYPVKSITLTGATSGLINTNHTFMATMSPFNATMPITTTWAATDQETITQTGGVIASSSWQWASGGLKTITVTAQNSSGTPVTATHQITINSPADLIIGPVELVTTPPITASTPVVFRTTITNTGEQATTSQFFIDVFINPTEINDVSIPLEQSSGYTAVSSLAAKTSKVVTITAPFGFPPDVITHSVYAMVDSLNKIAEPNEQDNISQPLTVTHILPPPPFITVTPTCSSTPNATLTVNGYYWPSDEDIALYFDGNLRTIITEHDGSFSVSWQEQSIIVGQDYEITAVSPSHSASTTLTTPCQPAAPTRPTLTGPTIGHIGEPLTFVATIDSETTVQPLTYTWYISKTYQITHTNGLTDTMSYTWDTLGQQGIWIIVANEYGHSSNRYLFEIVEQQVFLPVIMKPEE